MRLPLKVIIACVVSATCLGGCVAAVVPLVAGGAIAQRGLSKDGPPPEDLRETGGLAGSRPAQPMAGSELHRADLAGSAYEPFIERALQFAGESFVTDHGASALLRNPADLEAERATCDSLPPAVLIDLDPAERLLAIDYDRQQADPALGPALARLRDSGIEVVWISGHGPETARSIRGLLAETRLDPDGADPLVLMRFAGESKQRRRRDLGTTYCLVAIAGDQRTDFDDLYEYVLDPTMAAPLEAMIGNGWFLMPPPLG